MSIYKCSTLHPIEPARIEQGLLKKTQAFDFIKNYDWKQDLQVYADLTADDVKNTPGILLEDQTANETLRISNISTDYTHFKYLITFTRPVTLTYFWGLFSRKKEQHCSYHKVKDEKELHELLELFFEKKLEEKHLHGF